MSSSSGSSSSIINDTTRFVTLQGILAYLQKQVNKKAAAVSDHEALHVAIKVITEQFQLPYIDMGQQNLLEELVEEFGPKNTVDQDPKFIEFIQLLQQKGFFNGADEGSEQWYERYQKAKDKFAQRQQQQTTTTTNTSEISVEERMKLAEKCKDEGNELHRLKKYEAAIEKYKEALVHNPNSHVYHSNMAAAYMKTKDFHSAIECCEKAIQINEKYAKAYGRMGHALEELGKAEEAEEGGEGAEAFRLEQAIAYYEAARDLEPQTADYRQKLTQATSRLDTLKKEGAAAGAVASGGGSGNPMMDSLASMFGGLGGGAGGSDPFASLLSNPAMQQMAQQFMQNPAMQQMAMQMMGNMGIGTDDSGMLSFSEEQLSELERDEQVVASSKLQQVLGEIREGGIGVLDQYKSDSEVTNFFVRAMQRMMARSMPATGGAGGGFPGGLDMGSLASMFGGLGRQ